MMGWTVTFAFAGAYAVVFVGAWFAIYRDRLGLWFGVAVVLVPIAYAIPRWDLMHLIRYGRPRSRNFQWRAAPASRLTSPKPHATPAAPNQRPSPEKPSRAGSDDCHGA